AHLGWRRMGGAPRCRHHLPLAAGGGVRAAARRRGPGGARGRAPLMAGRPSASGLLIPFLAVQLGGFLALDRDRDRHWCWSGACVYPVGSETDWRQREAGTTPYHLLRGFSVRTRPPHEGADLGNGQAGGRVHACAHGLVVQAVRGDTLAAWGDRIVLAHRLTGGSLVYSVYAHLLPGSLRVRAGQAVAAGQWIARVGSSGNATTPHLHFEVRRAGDPGERWEHAEAVDPLAFVERRLVARRDRDDWRDSLMSWAE